MPTDSDPPQAKDPQKSPGDRACFPAKPSETPGNIRETRTDVAPGQIVGGLGRNSLRERVDSGIQPGAPRIFRGEISSPKNNPEKSVNGVEYFRVPQWGDLSWLWHGFSSRRGGGTRAYCPEDAPGELNLGFTVEDDRAIVLRNRALLSEAVTGSPETPLVTVRQIHSNIVIADERGRTPEKSGEPCEGDGLMSDEPGRLLAIQTADCIPVLVVDTRRRAVAAFHAGWRGTVKKIVESGIAQMHARFGSKSEDLRAAIGPGIGACCYAIGEEVMTGFEAQFSYAKELFREVSGHSPASPKLHLDLIEANRRQLLSAGLADQNVEIVRGCTNCHPEMFFSYRNSGGRCGRMMSVIGVRPSELAPERAAE